MVLKNVPWALHFYAETITCIQGHVGDAQEAGGFSAAFSCSSTSPSTTHDVEGNTMAFPPPLQAAYMISPAPFHFLLDL